MNIIRVDMVNNFFRWIRGNTGLLESTLLDSTKDCDGGDPKMLVSTGLFEFGGGAVGDRERETGVGGNTVGGVVVMEIKPRE